MGNELGGTMDLAGYRQAELIRLEHNGVFSVRLFLGHDGHNHCYLHDYDVCLAEGQSGQSMTEAVDRAVMALRKRRFWDAKGRNLEIAALAAQSVSDSIYAVFSTENFQRAVILHESGGFMLTGDEVVEILSDEPKIVRLAGGCYWLLLPNNLERF